MSVARKVLGWVFIVLMLPGCTAYRTVPDIEMENGIIDPFTAPCDLQEGDNIRITTVEGDRVSGEIKEVAGEYIVLHPNRKPLFGGGGDQGERTIEVGSIGQVEKLETSGGLTALLIIPILAVGAVVFAHNFQPGLGD